jgi:hypothetical protein
MRFKARHGLARDHGMTPGEIMKLRIAIWDTSDKCSIRSTASSGVRMWLSPAR